MNQFQTGDVIVVTSDKSRNYGKKGIFLNYCKNGQSDVCSVQIETGQTVNLMEYSIRQDPPIKELHFFDENPPQDCCSSWNETLNAIHSDTAVVNTTQLGLLSTQWLFNRRMFIHTNGHMQELYIGGPFMDIRAITINTDLAGVWMTRARV